MAENNVVYDIAIIGGGPGGYVAAIRATQMGAKVALIEKDRIGGTCLNRGCIPTKAMVSQAEVYEHTLRAAEFGVDLEGTPKINFARFMQRKDEVTEVLVSGVEQLIKAQGIAVIPGAGRIMSPNHIRVNDDTTIECRKMIIATGSVPMRVGIPGVDLPGVIDSDQLLQIKEQPKELVVIGGSVVGIEFASIFNAIGTKVSVVGRKTFLKDADDQLAKRYRSMLSRQGASVTIGVDFKQIVQTDQGKLRVEYERKGKPGAAEGDLVLLSTGRAAFTDGLGLKEMEIEMQGYNIKVDDKLETCIPGVYAIGDVIGGYQLAHVASYEGEVAVENALGHERRVDYRAVPACIFTMPEIASVGITSSEVKEQGLDVVMERFPFGINGRALALGETEGQVRMICEKGPDGRGGKVLGVHIMGPHASDLIAEATVAIQFGLTARDLADTIHAHPTAAETVMEVAKAAAYGEAIHYRKV